jgi:putative ABC transport system permease protein
MGIEPAWHVIENRSVTLGRPFSLVDERQGRAVCLVNPVARDKLRLPRECVGTSILLGDRRFTVIGVVEPEGQRSLFGGASDALEVFIPFQTAMTMRPNNNIGVVAAARSPDVSDDARAEITFFLRNKRQIRPGDPETFRVDALQKFIDRFQDVALTITMVAGGIVGISLIVGGVGIMNIMLVSVGERTREIGLRKAVGARPSAILLQFLVEAVTLCLVGGLLGVIVGEGIAAGIAAIPGTRMDKSEIPVWAIVVSFSFSAVVGLVFGMFPAIKASRLDPIEALRHE